MILLIFLLFILALYGIASILDDKEICLGTGNDYTVVKTIYALFGAFTIFMIILVNSIVFTCQKSSYVELRRLSETKQLYINRADDIGKKMHLILMEKYPDYEKNLLQNLKPDDVKLLFYRYPNLQASTTMMQYSRDIYALYDQVYTIDRMIRDVVAQVRFNNINPWAFNWVIPSPPDRTTALVCE